MFAVVYRSAKKCHRHYFDKMIHNFNHDFLLKLLSLQHSDVDCPLRSLIPWQRLVPSVPKNIDKHEKEKIRITDRLHITAVPLLGWVDH